MKSTMRLVLALAAHFRPETFKAEQGMIKAEVPKTRVQRTPSMMTLAAEAAAALAEASKSVNDVGSSLRVKYRLVFFVSISDVNSVKLKAQKPKAPCFLYLIEILTRISKPSQSRNARVIYKKI